MKQFYNCKPRQASQHLAAPETPSGPTPQMLRPELQRCSITNQLTQKLKLQSIVLTDANRNLSHTKSLCDYEKIAM